MAFPAGPGDGYCLRLALPSYIGPQNRDGNDITANAKPAAPDPRAYISKWSVAERRKRRGSRDGRGGRGEAEEENKTAKRSNSDGEKRERERQREKGG